MLDKVGQDWTRLDKVGQGWTNHKLIERLVLLNALIVGVILSVYCYQGRGGWEVTINSLWTVLQPASLTMSPE